MFPQFYRQKTVQWEILLRKLWAQKTVQSINIIIDEVGKVRCIISLSALGIFIAVWIHSWCFFCPRGIHLNFRGLQAMEGRIQEKLLKKTGLSTGRCSWGNELASRIHSSLPTSRNHPWIWWIGKWLLLGSYLHLIFFFLTKGSYNNWLKIVLMPERHILETNSATQPASQPSLCGED